LSFLVSKLQYCETDPLSVSKMKFASAAILVFISMTLQTFARTISNGAEVDVRELVEKLRDAIIMNEKKEMEAKKEEDHEISTRGVLAKFKKSVRNAGAKVENAYEKKEEAHQLGGPSHADRVAYKQEIVQWRKMVRDFGIENEPEIKEMAAQLDAMWVALDLDNVWKIMNLSPSAAF